MKLRYEQDQEYSRWCRSSIHLVWIFVATVLLVEICFFAMQLASDSNADVYEYLVIYIVRPFIVYGILLAAMHLFSDYLLKKKRYVQQAVMYLTAVSLGSLSIVWTHSDIAVAHMVLAFPVLLSVIYVERWALYYTFFLNLIFFFIFVYILPPTYPLNAGMRPSNINIVVMVAMMVGAFGLAGMLRKRQQVLIDGIVAAHNKSKQDSLTGLYNHAAFYERLDEYILQQKSDETGFCLIVLDIDNFKSVNDRFGHAVGDVVITTLVSTIKASLRKDEEAFRYGGEEFTVLSSRSPQQGQELAEEIITNFRNTLSDTSWGTPVTCSAGVCAYNAERFGARREFFAAADEALYEAKSTGKDRAVLWSEEYSRRWKAFE